SGLARMSSGSPASRAPRRSATLAGRSSGSFGSMRPMVDARASRLPVFRQLLTDNPDQSAYPSAPVFALETRPWEPVSMHALPDPPGLIGRAHLAPPPLARPKLGYRITCGFPSPAEDFMGEELDLNTRRIGNPVATF